MFVRRIMLTKVLKGLSDVSSARLFASCINNDRLHLVRNTSNYLQPLPRISTVLCRAWRSESPLCSSVKMQIACTHSLAYHDKEHHGIQTIGNDNNLRMLDVKWSNGHTTSYPYVYLRDCCLCSECHDASTGGRRLRMQDLDVDCKPDTVQFAQSADSVVVTWYDGHKSIYPLNWLAERSFPVGQKLLVQPRHDVRLKLWNGELRNHIPTFDFYKLLTDDYALYQWLYKLQEMGCTLITGTPLQEGQLKKIGQRIAYVRQNIYGELFTMKAKANHSHLAYTTTTLAYHTDLPYYCHTPGVQLFHCLEQTQAEGGENIIMDGFYAAKVLKQEDPEAFKILSTTNVDFEVVGEDFVEFHMLHSKPILWLDKKGDMYKLSYNNVVRSYRQNIPLDKVEPLYRAIKRLDDIINTEGNHVLYKLKPGEMLCVDNWRVLHGRQAFTDTENNSRHVEGVYLDWDELHSRFRVLAKKLPVDITKNPD